MELIFFSLYAGVGLLGMWMAYRVTVLRDYRYIRNIYKQTPAAPDVIAPKLARLFGIAGISFVLLPVWLTWRSVPASRWHYAAVGLCGIFGGIRQLMLWRHEKKYSPLRVMSRPGNGIFYLHIDLSTMSETSYIIDFEKKQAISATKKTKKHIDITKLVMTDAAFNEFTVLYKKILDRSFPFPSNSSYPGNWHFELLHNDGIVTFQSELGKPEGLIQELETALKNMFKTGDENLALPEQFNSMLDTDAQARQST